MTYVDSHIERHMRRYFTERLIRACAELPKMCEFFHVPFQSGDNDILRQMKCVLVYCHQVGEVLRHGLHCCPSFYMRKHWLHSKILKHAP